MSEELVESPPTLLVAMALTAAPLKAAILPGVLPLVAVSAVRSSEDSLLAKVAEKLAT